MSLKGLFSESEANTLSYLINSTRRDGVRNLAAYLLQKILAYWGLDGKSPHRRPIVPAGGAIERLLDHKGAN